MHISEGVLSVPVLATGAATGIAGLALGLRRTLPEAVPKTALLSSVFFIASLVHVPVGPVNMHLVLNGLLGLILGWAAVPAILVALFLQAVLFQFGGLTTLGVNLTIMAAPAVLVHYLFRHLASGNRPRLTAIGGFLAGSTAILAGGCLMALSLAASGEPFWATAKLALAAHAPLMLVEGVITAAAALFLRRVKPELLCMEPPDAA